MLPMARRPGLGIHRSSLFSALYNKAKAVGINWRTGHRVTGRGGPRLLLDQARTSLEFDLIVDASGAGSKLSPLKATRLGFGAIWGTVDYVGGVPIDHLSQRYRRADRMIGILPIGYLAGSSKPKAALFWSLKQERYQDWLAGGLERWKEEAIGLWPEVEPYVCQISEPEQMTMARYRPWYTLASLRREDRLHRGLLPTGPVLNWVRGRIWRFLMQQRWRKLWKGIPSTRH